jgi:hypothetical protein
MIQRSSLRRKQRLFQLLCFGSLLVSCLRTRKFLWIDPQSDTSTTSTTTEEQRIMSSPEQRRGTGTERSPRLLLGIFSLIHNRNERELRHVIRKTYLHFDKTHQTSTPHRVCSLQEFSFRRRQEYWKADTDECQMVYTFVFGGNETEQGEPMPLLDFNTSSSSSSRPLTIDPSLMDRPNHERGDVVYLNTPDDDAANNKNSNNVRKLWNWYQYTRTSNLKHQFDYVAYTDTRVRLCPTEFWQNDLFRTTSQKQLYGGLLGRDSMMMRRFVLLSSDMVDYYVSNSNPHEMMTRDVAVAKTLQSHPGFKNNVAAKVVVVALDGIHPVPPNTQHAPDYMLKSWDKYKDRLMDSLYEVKAADPDDEMALVRSSSSSRRAKNKVRTNAVETTPPLSLPPPRLLLGIFSMDSPMERERRALIRETYLTYFQNRSATTTTTRPTPNRICSLQQLFLEDSLLPLPPHADGGDSSCQMVYTFVLGGNPNGPTELVEPNASYPLTIDEPSISINNINKNNSHHHPHADDESDIVFLNIRENMKEGKSQTWFKYAISSTVNPYNFDYIAKTDTDTVIFPELFLDKVVNKLPRLFPHNVRVYGGDAVIKDSVEELLVGPAYMAGRLYWMSPDLARYITSDDCPRNKLTLFSEDKSIGNFVHSHPLPIRRVRVDKSTFRHPAKRPEAFLAHWKNHLMLHHSVSKS